TTLSWPGSTAQKLRTAASLASLMPAMPPPLRPWARTPEALKCSSWASSVTNTSSSSPVVSSTAPKTWSPSLRENLELVLVAGIVGVHPLDDAVAGPQRQPLPRVLQGAERQRERTSRKVDEGRQRCTTGQRRRTVGWRERRQLEGADAHDRAGRGDQTDRTPRGGSHGRDDDVVLATRAPGAQRFIGR